MSQTQASPSRSPFKQMDPSVHCAYYEFHGILESTTQLLAQVLAVNEDHEDFRAGHEYWKFNPSLSSIDTSHYTGGLKITKQSLTWAEPLPFQYGPELWDCLVNPDWHYSGGYIDCHYFISDTPPGKYGFYMHIETTEDRRWVGDLLWIRPVGSTELLFKVDTDYQLAWSPLQLEGYQVVQTGPGWQNR